MKLAAVQMVSSSDVAANLATASRWIGEAAAQGAALVLLPEYFCHMGLKEFDKLALAEPATPVGDRPGATSPIQSRLSEAASTHGVWLIGGTLPLRTASDARRVHNTVCVFGPDGTLTARYDKLHLFCYDNGRESHDEGRAILAGDAPQAFSMPDGAAQTASPLRVGLSVCYDLRFPELYRALMRPPCDLITVPAAFTHTTGKAHWELLLRARAVENQCYVLAAAQGGLHENGRRTWGHSLVIDPWGTVLDMLPEGEGIVTAELDTERLAAVRQQLPALTHRRL